MSNPKKPCLERPEVYEEPIPNPDFINNLNDDCLGTIFQFLPLEDKFRITGVCKRWRELEDLAWETTKSLGFADLDLIEPHLKPTDLQQLPPKARTKEGIERVLKKCGCYLEGLYFKCLINSDILLDIGAYCQNLVILEIFFEEKYWNKLDCRSLLRLQKLYLMSPTRDNRTIAEELFHNMPRDSLIDLDIRIGGDRNALLPRAALSALRDSKKLSILFLHGIILLSDFMNLIAEKTTIESLSLSNSTLHGQLPSFILLTNLQNLDLGDITQVNDETLIEISKNLQQLKTLGFQSNTVSDRGISSLRHLTKLVELYITKSPGVTDAPLSTMHQLEVLHCLYCRGIRDDGIITLIKHASNLECLDLRETGVTQGVLNAANEIMKQRTNNIKLDLEINQDLIDDWMVENKSPLLDVHD